MSNLKLTREECVKARDIIYKHVNCDEMTTEEFNDSVVVFNNLINEHFELVKDFMQLDKDFEQLEKSYDNLYDKFHNLKPLKFEELKEGMWVWDNKYKHYIKIRIVNNINSFIGYYPNFEVDPITDELYENLQGIFFFEENRFYRYEVK